MEQAILMVIGTKRARTRERENKREGREVRREGERERERHQGIQSYDWKISS
jgi:hypothetical protein